MRMRMGAWGTVSVCHFNRIMDLWMISWRRRNGFLYGKMVSFWSSVVNWPEWWSEAVNYVWGFDEMCSESFQFRVLYDGIEWVGCDWVGPQTVVKSLVSNHLPSRPSVRLCAHHQHIQPFSTFIIIKFNIHPWQSKDTDTMLSCPKAKLTFTVLCDGGITSGTYVWLHLAYNACI